MLHRTCLLAVALLLSLGFAARAEEAAPIAKESTKKTQPAEKPKTDAKAEAKTPTGGKPNLPVRYATLIKELNLSGAELEKFTAAVLARQQSLEQWKKEHGANFDKAKKALAEARKAEPKDAAAIEKLEKEVAEFNAQIKKLETEGDAAIHAALTPEHLAMVECYDMYTGLLRTKVVVDAKITDEQKEKIKTLCFTQAKKIQELKADDTKGRAAIRAEVLKAITTDIFTDEQRAAMPKTEPKKEAPKAEPKKEPAKTDKK